MATKNRDKKGAIFIEGEDGRDKLLGFKAISGGILGIAIMKNGRLQGFKPIAEFLKDFNNMSEFLVLSEAAKNSSAIGTGGIEKKTE